MKNIKREKIQAKRNKKIRDKRKSKLKKILDEDFELSEVYYKNMKKKASHLLNSIHNQYDKIDDELDKIIDLNRSLKKRYNWKI